MKTIKERANAAWLDYEYKQGMNINMLTINGGIRFFDKSKADNPDIEENQNDQRK